MKTLYYHAVIYGTPRTKKNSMRILSDRNKKWIAPSAAYMDYRNNAITQLSPKPEKPIDSPVNVRCMYYMPTHRRVDLCNLIEATCDILVDAKVLKDDNSTIVCCHDGSRVRYDKDIPRVEIVIESIRGDVE